MGGLKSIQEGLKDKIIELAVRYIVQEIVEDTYRADVRRIEDEVKRLEDKVKRLEDKVKRLEDKVKRLEDEIHTAETFANTYQLAY
jgi:predicted nuclease with TOPRIM domain